MNRYAAIIDACVLGGGLKRNIILSLAEAGLFRPYWSERILDETEKAILAISKGTADPGRQRRAIERAFPEAIVPQMDRADLVGALPDPDDEHVLASAIAARCDTLVTDNLKDFTLPDLAKLLYGPSAGGGWRSPAGGLFSVVAMPLEWVGLLTRTGKGGIDEMVWCRTPLWGKRRLQPIDLICS